MKTAKITTVALTVLILGLASVAKADNQLPPVPDTASTMQLMMLGLGTLGVAFRGFKRSK